MTSILKVDTIQDQAGNNIINESSDTITIGASGDTITIPSGATIDLSSATQTGVGGTNTPIIFAQAVSATSMTNGVDTKITLDNEIIDTDGVFASSRFTATTAGKYKVTAVLSVNLTVATAALNLFIKKNGGTLTTGIAKSNEGSANTVSAVANLIVSLSATDYIELFGSQNNGTTVNTNTGIYTNLSIIKLVE